MSKCFKQPSYHNLNDHVKQCVNRSIIVFNKELVNVSFLMYVCSTVERKCLMVEKLKEFDEWLLICHV